MSKIKLQRNQADKQEKWNQLFFEYFQKGNILHRDSFANSSVVLHPEYNGEMDRLCAVLSKASKAIVLNYFEDSRIRNYYQLDNDLEGILKKSNSQTYNQGFYRPDFLYDTNDQPKICEIGARYPLNGWMISYYSQLIHNRTNSHNEKVHISGTDLENLIDDLSHRFAPHRKVALIHDDEKGSDIFNAQRELAKLDIELISAKPQDLIISNNLISVNGVAVSQFILEMDREELKKISPDVLDKLIEENSYFNDIRTLILIHDKRVLAVMYDAQIMQDYLSEEDYSFLRNYLIPSFVITDPADCDAFTDTEQNLILKLNSGGRGIGAYVKSDCTNENWNRIVRENWDKYLIQHFVDQKEFNDTENNRQIYLVGMLLCKDDKTYGSGIFRGSDESVVNVHQGRALIYPIAQ
ncbi:hypothetical protein ACHRVW_05045 [Flavobacterium collinsii]|uniref:Glutathionylspermidine synthase pre-ATP-grasp-like domain-containing protein n=1 Tax=Flavobacterium collinsii TaxID=1114861 RepID=A0A9W4X237_9FLAO|nr:hypothetical protein [Flavobacterium collinsii]CAA9200516.1 hypothetical protein FLACOL7796_03300 [Flavobacterium collinsii]CAI2765508.1 conserved protein of unknown function [Flavobacterium collinsii]